MNHTRSILLLGLTASLAFSVSAPGADKEKKLARPEAPTRPFDAPGAPKFTRLDGKPGVNPPVDADGDFLVGPEYVAAPETEAVEGAPQGRVQQFSMDSRECKRFNPGIARDAFGTVDPDNPKTLIVETHPIDYKRTVTVYVPAQYVPGSEAPFIVVHDGPGMGKPDNMNLARILDNLIAQHRVPAMIAILISSGGGDAQGHERGREYDTMSGLYAEFIENEVLPLVEKNYRVKLTKDPEGRATMGNSSGGSAALIMAWYHPELYRRVLTFSGTFVNQQWPFNPETPDGAWGFHNKLIPGSDPKPLRIWMAVGDRDNLNPNVMRDGMHDWVEANNRMATVLKAKGYHYQYLYCLDAGHGVRNAKPQLLPHALEWLWNGYQSEETPSAPQLAAVRAADDARVNAMTHPSRDGLSAVFSDELRYSHSNGKVDTKASFIEALTSGKAKYAAMDYEERSFTFPAPTIALMTGRARVHFASIDAPATILGFLAVWRLEDGQWRFLAWQSYKVPVDAGK